MDIKKFWIYVIAAFLLMGAIFYIKSIGSSKDKDNFFDKHIMSKFPH